MPGTVNRALRSGLSSELTLTWLELIFVVLVAVPLKEVDPADGRVVPVSAMPPVSPLQKPRAFAST